jgi:hypothetical protein
MTHDESGPNRPWALTGVVLGVLVALGIMLVIGIAVLG